MSTANLIKSISKQASKQASKSDYLNLPKKSSKSSEENVSGDLILSEKLIKSKKRVKKFGEVFTPEFIVKQMCDLCEPQISQIDGKIFEPTCGNGNFLVEILRRKLSKIKFKNKKQFEFEVILALSNIYAVDIQADNVHEARNRLHAEVLSSVGSHKSSIHFLNAIETVLSKTIIVGNTLTQKSKLIFYDFKPNYKDFSFEISSYSLKEIENTFAKTKKATIDNLVDIINQSESPPPKTKPKPKQRRAPIEINEQLPLINKMEIL